jgi:hypothetical protein
MGDDLQTAQGSGLPIPGPANSDAPVRRLKAQLAVGRTLEEFRICD